MAVWRGLFGLAGLMALAWLVSENRRRIPLKTVLLGVLLQLAVALLLLKLPASRQFFLLLNQAVLALDRATAAGTSLVFGYLGGGPLPFAESAPGASFILAFRALPLVLVVSALSALLFHWRILPRVVGGFSWLLRRVLTVGGAVAVGAAASLLGTKTILNEFVAYLDLAALPAGTLSPRSRLIMTYALCGFANFGSLGIMLGGMGAMVPERRGEITALGLKSIMAGTLATCMTGAVVGFFS